MSDHQIARAHQQRHTAREGGIDLCLAFGEIGQLVVNLVNALDRRVLEQRLDRGGARLERRRHRSGDLGRIDLHEFGLQVMQHVLQLVTQIATDALPLEDMQGLRRRRVAGHETGGALLEPVDARDQWLRLCARRAPHAHC